MSPPQSRGEVLLELAAAQDDYDAKKAAVDELVAARNRALEEFDAQLVAPREALDAARRRREHLIWQATQELRTPVRVIEASTGLQKNQIASVVQRRKNRERAAEIKAARRERPSA